ncbi:DUF1214 domain-containing protein [Alcanivorax sp.]|jgi:hypothetical protein|uniref:DUF1214 domain-containing protein n=1 Tax=Alcanivorax sp. TaxID=1872427 RepID=UPI0032D99A24
MESYRKLTGLSVLMIGALLSGCNDSQPENKQQNETMNTQEAAKEEKREVTADNYIRAEMDGRMEVFQKRAGDKVNAFYLIRKPTPTDEQPVVRMNRDTLYGGSVIDTEGGAWVNVPEMPDDRYFSLFIIDNDHYVVDVITESGRHKIPEGTTKYVVAVPRVQLNDYSNEEIKRVNGLLDQFKIDATSADAFKSPNWDWDSMLALRANYEKEFVEFEQYPADWMDVKGKANEATRHLAAAGAWGLFPEEESVYINYQGPSDPDKCYVGTYGIPENKAFWSITVYGDDAFMKSDNATISDRTAELNDDGTVTVYYGSQQHCGEQDNRLDITKGWNLLMRVYRPGESVLNREYTLPDVEVFTPKA